MTKLYGKDDPYKQPTVNERINRLGGTPEPKRPTADEIIYGVVPDGKTDPEGWKRWMKARLAPRIKRRTGLADKDQNLNVLLKEIISELEEIDEIGDFEISKGIMRRRTTTYVKQRVAAKADKQRQADEKAEIYEYGRYLRMKDVHIAAVIAKITAGIGYANRCHDALDAYRSDNPEPTSQGETTRGFYETGTVPDTTGIATSVEDFVARQRTAPPVAPEPSDTALDDTFGKKADKPPVINPGNWTHDATKLRKFYANLNDKAWNKYGIPDADRSNHIHTALDVTSLHETNLSPDVALVTILVYLEKLFAPKESDVTKLTIGDWTAWLKEHGWKSADVLSILNNHCISNNEAPVTKFSEWPSDLHEAEMAVEAALDENDAKRANSSADSKPTAPTLPAEPETPVQSSTASVEPANESIIDKEQFRKQRTIKISGQAYLKAADRVIMFRADHPDWTLKTEALQLLPDFAVFKAEIINADGRLISTGHGFCTPQLAQKVSGRFVEKAETAAIARALALLGGYGTDDTLDDSDYLSDSPIAA